MDGDNLPDALIGLVTRWQDTPGLSQGSPYLIQIEGIDRRGRVSPLGEITGALIRDLWGSEDPYEFEDRLERFARRRGIKGPIRLSVYSAAGLPDSPAKPRRS